MSTTDPAIRKPIRLTTAEPLPFAGDRRWTALADSLSQGQGTSAGPLAGVVDEMGLPAAMVADLQAAIAGDEMRGSVAFCRSRDLAVNILVGPYRAFDHAPREHGLLVLQRDEIARSVVATVSEALKPIGEALFGRPLSFGGRHVEFYDVAFGTGPVIDAGGAAIALFAPWCQIDGPEAQSLRLLSRTVLLTNVVAARHEQVTRPIAERYLQTDGDDAAAVGRDPARLRACVALWLTLHELLHACGPQPLFASGTAKEGAGLAYAAIEEFRVDATAWLVLRRFGHLLGPFARETADLILLERLCRSAMTPQPTARPSAWGRADRLHGELWLAAALRNAEPPGADGTLRVDRDGLQSAVTSLLDEIYTAETSTASAGAEAAAELADAAARIADAPERRAIEGIRRLVGERSSLPERFPIAPGFAQHTGVAATDPHDGP